MATHFPTLNEQMDVISAGTAEILPQDELAQKVEHSIKTNTPLRVKLGCDPSRPDLHIGHAVVLQKLRDFQDLGHHGILIVGDFTASIGDPTGKSKTRPALTIEETREFGRSYFEQAGKVLNTDTIEIVHNSDWLDKMTFTDVIKLSAKYTVAQMLERDDFSKRYKSGQPISIHEFLYPLAQGMDSVAIKSDVELGGTDQKFNLLVGRALQKEEGMSAQCCIMMPILEGTDGVEKMSKSLDNYIGVTDSPRDMFGKTMSIPDNMISRYYQYGGWASPEETTAMQTALESGELHPRTAKVQVAQSIIERYYDKQTAEAAFAEFERIFVKKDVPDEIDEFVFEEGGPTFGILTILSTSGMCKSNGEARRMIKQNAVSVDGEKCTDPEAELDITEKRLIKVGKKRFLYVRAK